jgi:RHS repeat-associated protein
MLLTGQTWSGAVAGSVGHTYNSDLQIATASVNGGNTVTFQYDRDALLTQAGALALAYNAQNRLRTGSTLGGVTDTVTYNGYAEVSQYVAAYGGVPQLSRQYGRDNLGRISAITETIGGTTDVYAYTYDPAGFLAGVSKNGAPIAGYTYDSNGNRLPGTYDAQDRLTQSGSTTYAYTANGELLSKTNGAQTTTYQYDALGNLLAVSMPGGTNITYLVDGQNRRVGRKVNNALVQGFLYDDQLRIAAELDGSNVVVSRFVYGTRDNVPDFMLKGGVTYRIIADHLGSPRLVVNASTGAVAQRLDYDAFGNVTNDTNPGFQPFGFAGGLYDSQSKLLRFGFRDYDAETGRWTTKDPILFDGGQTNLYRYVYNDPVNWRDPTGLCDDEEPPHEYTWWQTFNYWLNKASEAIYHALHGPASEVVGPALTVAEGAEVAAEGIQNEKAYFDNLNEHLREIDENAR